MATPTIQSLRYLKNAGIFEDLATGTFGHEFKRYNLIYGFNGSGKTTLSRLIESMSELGLNENLPEGLEFCFGLNDGSRPGNHDLDNPAARFIPVFNEDFVERTLTWKMGEAKPIIYIGTEQTEAAEQLSKLEPKFAELSNKDMTLNAECAALAKELENHCRDSARMIAEQLNLGRRYTAANLKSDYDDQSLGSKDRLDENERAQLRETVFSDEVPPKLQPLPQIKNGIELAQKTKEICGSEVATLAIEALERRKDALDWVKTGLHLHDAEEECLFCGNRLSSQRRDALREALEKGFDRLSQNVDATQLEASRFRDECARMQETVKSSPRSLPHMRDVFDQSRAELVKGLQAAIDVSEAWQSALSQKKANPSTHPVSQLERKSRSWYDDLHSKIINFNEKIDNHNNAVEHYATEKSEAVTKLKRHFLADSQLRFSELVRADSERQVARAKLAAEIEDVSLKIREVTNRLREHGPAAATMNAHLASYLGHPNITLEATDDGYQVCRFGQPSTKPLSEGEKTAVAFCYFLTSIEANGRKRRDTIVILDDPISSLDTRAMTHVVSVVRRKFVDTAQLFILTHNLDFMREMKKWLHGKRDKGEADFYFVETTYDRERGKLSKIVEMPRLIRDYESEYHYLFKVVKDVGDHPAENEKFAYLIPNAIRKVLDIFLAFKVPGASGLEPKVDKIVADHAGLDGERVKAMERLAQLESHSESIGDVTTFSAYTLEQVSDAASCLIEMIEIVDPEHFTAMRRLCR